MRKAVRVAVGSAKKLSRRFYGFRPRRLRAAKIVWPKALVLLGGCAQVDYVSDKHDRKLRQYFHEFEPGVLLLAGERPQPNGYNLLLIFGKFDITKDGLVG